MTSDRQVEANAAYFIEDCLRMAYYVRLKHIGELTNDK